MKKKNILFMRILLMTIMFMPLISATAWNISTAINLNINFTDGAECSGGHASLFFSSSQDKMYIACSQLNQYNLSTPSLVSSAVLEASDTNINDSYSVFFNSSGTGMYTINSTHFISGYKLSTAWNISTATLYYRSNETKRDETPTGMFFKNDGTRFYISGTGNNSIYEYQLSQAWNISTFSFTSSYNVSNQSTDIWNIYINDSGNALYLAGRSATYSDGIYQYNLTDWSLNTTNYTGQYYNSTNQTDSRIRGMFIDYQGRYAYASSDLDNQVFQYSMIGSLNPVIEQDFPNYTLLHYQTNTTNLSGFAETWDVAILQYIDPDTNLTSNVSSLNIANNHIVTTYFIYDVAVDTEINNLFTMKSFGKNLNATPLKFYFCNTNISQCAVSNTFYLTINQTSTSTTFPSQIGGLSNWLSGIFPDTNSLSFSVKTIAVVVTLIIVSLLTFIAGSKIDMNPKFIMVTTTVLDFFVIMFFVAIGYIHFAIIVLLILMFIGILYLNMRK